MKTTPILGVLAATALECCAMAPQIQPHARAADLQKWAIHDETRPMPPVVDPGPAGPPAPVPADAIVLFDGRDLSGWTNAKDGPASWRVRDGYMEVVKGAGSIKTTRVFGDCQLHVEWASPAPAVGSSQDRGNSGVFLMNTYEVQVLDSYQSKTYADGMAAAIYGQFPPLVNASRGPGEWQTYDIVFHAPRFDGRGARDPGAHDDLPQRDPGPGQRGTHRAHRAQGQAALQGPRRQASDFVAGPCASGALPQHLGPRTAAVTSTRSFGRSPAPARNDRRSDRAA